MQKWRKQGRKLKKLGPQIEKELEKAKLEIEKAKAEMKEYKAFVDGLENDGLINKKAGYTINIKTESLLSMGKKPTAQTYNKYRSLPGKA